MKTQSGKLRENSKEKSKQRFLNAVGQILKEKGFAGLKVNNIAATAGLDKKLIYNYFGGTDELLDEYLRQQDFWNKVESEIDPDKIKDGGKEFSVQSLLGQFDYVSENKEFQKVILWRLSEPREALAKLTSDQELIGEALFTKITNAHFGEKANQYKAIMAILVSSMYHLNLSSQFNGSVYCGIDVQDEQGRAEIKKAVSFLIEQTYKNL
ncbi:MAG: TetR/AcrR family transcriptional regulator [Pedobacter sp.]|nr:MAG: TetR/AcrR family transcriptional regulator [Pedobacter sp.]